MDMTRRCAAGLDIGTTTISLVVVEYETGKLIDSRTIENGSFIATENSWEKIQNPDIILSKAIRLLKEYREKYPEIAVLGLTGQMHGIVYLNENGECVSPLFTWQDGSGDVPLKDFCGCSVCQHLAEQYGIQTSTGYGLITYLYHCKTNQVPHEATQVCTIMDYLGMVLTGRKEPLMHSSNAASLGLYDVYECGFRTDILKEEGGTTDILPKVTDDLVELGSWDGITVGVAIGDNQASFLGSISDVYNTILVNMGTGGQVSVLMDSVSDTESGSSKTKVMSGTLGESVEIRPFASGKYLLAGSSLCGGRAYAVLKDFFAAYARAMGETLCDHYTVMNKLLETEPVEKLRVCTTFSGTRKNPEKRGTIENISIHNFTPESLIYGVLDGMAEELWQMYEEIRKELGITRTRMLASGNGIRRNPHLQRILAAKFNMTLQLAEQEEEAACGAVKAGLIAAGYMLLDKYLA